MASRAARPERTTLFEQPGLRVAAHAVAFALLTLALAHPAAAEADAADGEPATAEDVSEASATRSSSDVATPEDDPFLEEDPFDEEKFDLDDPFEEAEVDEAEVEPAEQPDQDGSGGEIAGEVDAEDDGDGMFFGLSNNEVLDEEEWPKRETEQLVEGIAAQVGGGVVLISEVERLSASVEVRMRDAGAPEEEIRKMRAEALDRLIESRLIEDVVKRAQLSATEAEVNQAISGIASENGLTFDQMTASIASHGLTTEEYRAKIKSEIERNKVVGSMVRSRVQVEDEDVEALFQQRYAGQRQSGSEIHLAHLLIATGAKQMRDERSACALAAKIRGRIQAGEVDFSAAARQYSDTNAERGGDLGWVHADELASWMAPAVSDLVSGQVSEVVPMYFGCNLLMLVDRREFKPVTFEEAQPELRDLVYRREMEEEYRNWIEKLRETVYVERKGIYAEASRLGNRRASR